MKDDAISRRNFVKTLARAVGPATAMLSLPSSASLWSSPSRPGESSKKNPPNIIFILADDMGYGDPQCLNPKSKIPTPNMDRLASEGMLFTDAHSPTAVCTPTRYGILTGRYCWRSRLKKWVLLPWDKRLIEPGRLTVASLLKEHGYQTACIGKWHLGVDYQKDDKGNWDFAKPILDGPNTVGFDYYFGMTGSANYPPYCFVENDHTVGIPSIPIPAWMYGTPGPMLPGWSQEEVLPTLTKKAVQYINEQAEHPSERPFFLYFPLTAPHTPIVPSRAFQGSTKAGPYGDFVAEVDWAIGEVLKTLDQRHLTDNTLVIVTSDNGSPGRASSWAPPYTEVHAYGHNPSGPWRGVKADVWDGGHRIPFMARWPRKIHAGSVCNDTICLTDFMATCADIVGARLPENAGEDSYDLMPLLAGKVLGKPLREATVHHSGDGIFAVRQKPWKVVFGRGSGGFTQPMRVVPGPNEPKGQLYNLAVDPQEKQNVWDQHPEVVKRLRELLEKYERDGRSAPIRGL
ncbi:MAG TPA: arylsulfatase [Terriglobia bacterium]|nr:arylsulfatase [Terriglobia bacterium]